LQTRRRREAQLLDQQGEIDSILLRRLGAAAGRRMAQMLLGAGELLGRERQERLPPRF
jgi:hypothetical protein